MHLVIPTVGLSQCEGHILIYSFFYIFKKKKKKSLFTSVLIQFSVFSIYAFFLQFM